MGYTNWKIPKPLVSTMTKSGWFGGPHFSKPRLFRNARGSKPRRSVSNDPTWHWDDATFCFTSGQHPSSSWCSMTSFHFPAEALIHPNDFAWDACPTFEKPPPKKTSNCFSMASLDWLLKDAERIWKACIWIKYNSSMTRQKTILGSLPRTNHQSRLRSQWGRMNWSQ